MCFKKPSNILCRSFISGWQRFWWCFPPKCNYDNVFIKVTSSGTVLENGRFCGVSNPGKKGGQSTSRVRPEWLPVGDVTKMEYASKRHSYAIPPNNEPFLLKQVANRLEICQGCRTSIRGWGGRIDDPSFDFCVSRMERRPYPTPEGDSRIPTRASNWIFEHLKNGMIAHFLSIFILKRSPRIFGSLFFWLKFSKR